MGEGGGESKAHGSEQLEDVWPRVLPVEDVVRYLLTPAACVFC